MISKLPGVRVSLLETVRLKGIVNRLTSIAADRLQPTPRYRSRLHRVSSEVFGHSCPHGQIT